MSETGPSAIPETTTGPPAPAPAPAPDPAPAAEATGRVNWGAWIGGGAIVIALIAAAWVALSRPAVPTLEEVEALIARGDFAGAARKAEAFVNGTPEGDHNRPRGLLALARARIASDDLPGAVEALRQVPDWSIRKAEALFQLGRALKVLHRGAEAERALLDCLARENTDGSDWPIQARLELMRLYGTEERLEELREMAWEVYGQLSPEEQATVLAMRIQSEFDQTEPATSRKQLEPMIEADPTDAYARAGLAAAYAHSSQPAQLEQARALYAEAVAAAPEDPGLRERYLDVLERLGDLDAMKATLAARPKGYDDRPQTQFFLGLVALQEGDLDAAAKAFTRAAEADPSSFTYPYRLAQVLRRQGREAEADARLADSERLRKGRDRLRDAWNDFASAREKAAAAAQAAATAEADGADAPPAPDAEPAPESQGLDPKEQARLVLGIASACEAAGLNREALAWYREALRLTPDDADAQAGLSRLGPKD